MKEKLLNGFFKIKSYWSKPPKGYEVSYKEITNYTIGFSSVGMLGVMIGFTGMAVSTPMMLSHFKLSSGLVFIMGMLGALIGIARAPLFSMLLDNSNSKSGKFKPFLMWTTVVSSVCIGIIPFIPASWMNNSLFTFSMPAMPIFKVEASKVGVSLGVVVMFVLLQIGTSIHQLYIQSLTGIENTVSSHSQERANITSVKNLIANLPNSIVQIIIPLIAMIFAYSYTDEITGEVINVSGMLDIRLYRIFFPICAIISCLLILFVINGVKERVVVDKNFVNKVKFSKGVKQISKNKYFWILLIFTIFIAIRGNSVITIWVCMYAIGGEKGDAVLALCSTVLNMGFIPGTILGPLFVKKFGKRNVLLYSSLLYAGFILIQLLAIKVPAIILISIFFQNLCGGVGYISVIMSSDVLDYEQYKSGKRLEGFWQNYNALILTTVGIFTSILVPFVLSLAGVGFGDGIDDIIKSDKDIMIKSFANLTILGLAGAVIAIIPIIFYDLSENKHSNIVRALHIRKIVENYNNNELEYNDVIKMHTIKEFVETAKAVDTSTLSKKQLKEHEDTMSVVVAEFDKLDCVDAILESYESAKEKAEMVAEKDCLEELQRNIDLEERIVNLKVKYAIKKNQRLVNKFVKKNKKNPNVEEEAEALKNQFNEEEYRQNLFDNSRFIKDKCKLQKLDEIGDVSKWN